MNKRVLFFIPDLYQGGVATVCENLLMGFSKHNDIELSVCIYDNKPISKKIPEGVKVFRINLPLWKNFGKNSLQRCLRGIIRYPAVIFGLLKYINIVLKENPDVIAAHSNIMNLYSLIVKLLFPKRKYKVIITEHVYNNSNTKKGLLIILDYLEKLLYPHADAIVAISNPIATYLQEEYLIDRSKICLIYNPLNMPEIITKAKEEINDIPNLFEQPVIITAGRFNIQKGQWHLIRSFKLVKQQIPDSKLVILGDGELKQYFINLTQKLNLENDVYLLGFQENPFKFISRSSVFALPSLSEGFVMVLLEAIACGVPVVSSDCRSGPREILAPDTDPSKQTMTPEFAEFGILVPVPDGTQYKPEDPLTKEEEILAEVLVNVLSDRKIQNKYKALGPQRAHAFDVDKITSKWINLINGLLS